jgi:cobyrinic acid a,c-diamide synthase
MIGPDACVELFTRAASTADVSVIEGVMGLYDGHGDGTGVGSSADLAKLLGVPVILVVDAKGLGQSAAAMVSGYKLFDPEVFFAGIILNNVASESHLEYLKKPIEDYTGLPVLAYMKRDTSLSIPERHLGLVPSQEVGATASGGCVAPTIYEELAERLIWMGKKGPLEIANMFKKISERRGTACRGPKQIAIGRGTTCRAPTQIAMAKDEAFHFYYQDNLDLLESLGARLLPFSPIKDSKLPPDVELIYIGGGFPELYAPQLEANAQMREEIRQAAERGVTIYAECGGLMYLMERLIDFEGRSYNMCGVFKGTSQMEKKRQALGYVIARAMQDNLLCKRGESIRGHVFHWSRLTNVQEDTTFAYELKRAADGTKLIGLDGLQRGNVLASYVHVHFAQNPALAANLLSSVRRVQA